MKFPYRLALAAWTAVAICVAMFACQSADAFGPRRSVVVSKQVVVQRNVVQRVRVQQVVARPYYAQAIVAQPVYAQQFAPPVQAYCAPQQFVAPVQAYSAPVVLQQNVHGCSQFFRAY